MMNQFILFAALRYFKAKRKSKDIVFIIILLCFVASGVIALMVTTSVMNGFQLSYINNILEISSFHIQVEEKNKGRIDTSVLSEIKQLPGVISIVPFSEFQVLVNRSSSFSKTVGGIVRAVGKEELASDTGFYKSIFSEDDFDIEFLKMKFDIDEPNTLVVGNLFEYTIGARKGSELNLSTVNDFSLNRSTGTEEESGASNRFVIKEAFKSGYSEIDLNYIFMSLKSAENLFSLDNSVSTVPITYGIKLASRYDDLTMKSRIASILGNSNYTVKTWRDFNQGFFGALLTEKLAMMILLGLIVILVGFSIFNTLRTIVYEKHEEIGVLKALGASPAQTKAIFIFEGFLIRFIGSVIGLTAGLIISSHINETFSIFTNFINFFINGIETGLSFFIPEIMFPRVNSPFSPDVFYLKEVPSKVIFEEALFIFFFAVFSATSSAFFATRNISKIKPAEVLRDE